MYGYSEYVFLSISVLGSSSNNYALGYEASPTYQIANDENNRFCTITIFQGICLLVKREEEGAGREHPKEGLGLCLLAVEREKKKNRT